MHRPSRRPRFAWSALVAALASLGLTLSLGGAPAGGASTAPKSISLLALSSSQVTASALGSISRYQHIIFQHWHHGLVNRIRTEAPGTQAMAYLEIAAVRYRDSCPLVPASIYDEYDSSPLSYCWVKRNHPTWLLKDKQGREVHFYDFPQLVALDIGIQDARNIMFQNAVKYLQDGNFHGAFLDDVMIRPAHRMGDGRDFDLAKYTDQQYGTAMRDYIAQFSSTLRNSGFVAMGNVGADPWTKWQADLAVSLSRYVIVHREFFSRWGAYCTTSGYSPRFTDPASNGNPSLQTFITFRGRVHANGGLVSGADYGSATPTSYDNGTMRYGRGQFLLTWRAVAGETYLYRSCGGNDPARAHWVREMGLPTAAAVHQANGLWRRPFQRGVVLVNATPGTTIRQPLPAGDYVDTFGKTWRGSITVPPRDAALLWRK